MKQIIINWLKENFNSCLNENETVLEQRAEGLENLLENINKGDKQ